MFDLMFDTIVGILMIAAVFAALGAISLSIEKRLPANYGQTKKNHEDKRD